jgi:hypothetical protein
MRTNDQVGKSIISKAYIGLIISLIIICILCFSSEVFLFAIINGVIAGKLTSLFLLFYWRGKGGSFFIIALLSPLVAIIMTSLPNFISLFQLVSAYFIGASALLMLYGFTEEK